MKKHLIMPLLAALVLASCEDDLLNTARSGDGSIQFGVTMNSKSRAGFPACELFDVIPMTSATGDSLYLFADVSDYPASRSSLISAPEQIDEFTVSATGYFDGATAKRNSAGIYEMSPTKYWPASGKLRFYAHSAEYAHEGGDSPTIHIQVPSDTKDHTDLLVSYTAEMDCASSPAQVPLNFMHALTCVKFQFGADMAGTQIKSITIKNTYTEGHFIYNMTDESEATSGITFATSGPHYDFVSQSDVTTNFDDYTVGTATWNDMDTEHSFLMLPQWLGDDVQVQITLRRPDATVDETVYGYITGKEWPAGKIVTYRVSYENLWAQLSVSQPDAFGVEGGSQTFKITSFYSDNVTNTPAAWTAEFQKCDAFGNPTDSDFSAANKPDWFTFDSYTGSGSVDPSSLTVTAAKQTDPIVVDMNALLKSNTTNLTHYEANPYNLAHPNGTYTNSASDIVNTANCYVIDGPGWYILPAVYGNGIVNGVDNKQAYAPGVTGDHVLSNFVNHLGNAITSPYITENEGCSSPAGAKMIWQDTQYLITDVKYDATAYGGKGGIIFQVPVGQITQGNANIALMSSIDGVNARPEGTIYNYPGDAMWSWHIWVSPFMSLEKTSYASQIPPVLLSENVAVTNYQKDTYNAMRVNLGWCSYNPVEFYNVRICKVRFTSADADGNKRYAYIDIVQGPEMRYWHGFNTYYQWGRKDPYQPIAKWWTSKTWYDNRNWEFAGQVPPYEKFGTGLQAIAKRILRPNYFHQVDEVTITTPTKTYKEGYDETFYNLWDATNTVATEKATTETVTGRGVKTIYDPCPVGYKVPPLNAFSGFTKTGDDVDINITNYKTWNGFTESYTYDCGEGYTNLVAFLFYTDSSHYNNIAFPCTGYRDWGTYNGATAAALQAGTDGIFWSNHPRDIDRAYYLKMMAIRTDENPHVRPMDSYLHVDGCSIRPVAE